MRLKPNHICLLVVTLLFSVSLSYAQESVSPVLEGMETEKANNRGVDYNYTDSEGSSQQQQLIPNNSQSTTVTDSSNGKVQTKPKTSSQKPVGEGQAKPEDSVLGFNFLYYIFQKYKMSDIID